MFQVDKLAGCERGYAERWELGRNEKREEQEDGVSEILEGNKWHCCVDHVW